MPLKLKKLVLENFKSYKSALWENLNPNLSILTGPNGQGKSNTFLALYFLLTGHLSEGTLARKRELLNVSIFKTGNTPH